MFVRPTSTYCARRSSGCAAAPPDPTIAYAGVDRPSARDVVGALSKCAIADARIEHFEN